MSKPFYNLFDRFLAFRFRIDFQLSFNYFHKFIFQHIFYAFWSTFEFLFPLPPFRPVVDWFFIEIGVFNLHLFVISLSLSLLFAVPIFGILLATDILHHPSFLLLLPLGYFVLNPTPGGYELFISLVSRCRIYINWFASSVWYHVWSFADVCFLSRPSVESKSLVCKIVTLTFLIRTWRVLSSSSLLLSALGW